MWIVRRYSFKGRASRLEFLAMMLVVPIVMVCVGVCLGDEPSDNVVGVIGLVLTALAVATSVRRFHDCGESGWSVLFLFIPIVNILFLVYLLFVPPKEKRYNGSFSSVANTDLKRHSRFTRLVEFFGGYIVASGLAWMCFLFGIPFASLLFVSVFWAIMTVADSISYDCFVSRFAISSGIWSFVCWVLSFFVVLKSSN